MKHTQEANKRKCSKHQLSNAGIHNYGWKRETNWDESYPLIKAWLLLWKLHLYHMFCVQGPGISIAAATT